MSKKEKPGIWKTIGLLLLWFVMPMTAFMEWTRQFADDEDAPKS